MLKRLFDIYKNFENPTNYILRAGLKICCLLCIFSLIILITYIISQFLILFYIGISIFRISIIFAIEFVVCSFVVDGITKNYI